MDCKKTESQLLDYFYKELPSEASASVQSHLESCDHCRVLFDKMSGVLSSASLSAEIKPNDFMATRVIAKLENEKSSSSRVRVVQYFLRPVMVVSLVVLGIFTGIEISNSLNENQANTYLAADAKTDLASQFASENYLTTTNDEVIEMYLNEQK
jgi:predicted anti-sigma-YlaC factor YlaD